MHAFFSAPVWPPSDVFIGVIQYYETHIPAQRNKAQENPRFSRTYENERRSSYYQCSQSARSRKAECIIEGFGFPKSRRLIKASDYQRVYQQARRGQYGPFSWSAHDNELSHPRLGMAIPKRLVKRSVDRSRIKRLLRESFRAQQHDLPAIDVIVSIRQTPKNLYDPETCTRVYEMWRRIAQAYLKRDD